MFTAVASRTSDKMAISPSSLREIFDSNVNADGFAEFNALLFEDKRRTRAHEKQNNEITERTKKRPNRRFKKVSAIINYPPTKIIFDRRRDCSCRRNKERAFFLFVFGNGRD